MVDAATEPDRPTLTVLYDGHCPLCSREITFLRKRASATKLGFFDISAAGADLAQFGVTYDDAMKELFVITSDGSKLKGMDSIRAMYRAIGWGWLLAPTAWPGLRTTFDLGYRLFARVRPSFNSRCKSGRCKSGRCNTDSAVR